MANDLRMGFEPSMTSLVSGIIADVQDLVRQQLALFREEVKGDVANAKEAAVSLALAGGVGFIGVGLLILSLVHLLHWATALPLWGCYGAVAVVFLAIGGVLYLAAKKKFDSSRLLPLESAQEFKESVQCLTKPK
jgi:uncharacterized membrane protein YqjE